MATSPGRVAAEALGCLGILASGVGLIWLFGIVLHDVPAPAKIALGVVLVVAIIAIAEAVRRRRGRFIRTTPLPVGLYDALRRKYPHLERKDCELAAHALRHFFLAYLHGGRRFVAMPSQAADELWHAYILHTRTYASFCRRAFGRFLHHTPAVALGTQRDVNAGLRRCWWQACKEENIDPRKPTRLPLLFALDAKLAIPDGFRYALDCHATAFAQRRADGTTQCAGDFSDSSIDGSTDGFGEGEGGDGGDGGGGCGGD